MIHMMIESKVIRYIDAKKFDVATRFDLAEIEVQSIRRCLNKQDNFSFCSIEM